MTGLGPDMSALNLLSQANLTTVLTKVISTRLLHPDYNFVILDNWQEAVDPGEWTDEASGPCGQHECPLQGWSREGLQIW